MRLLNLDNENSWQLLSEQKVSLSYQPVINLREQQVYCLEAFLNWQSLNVLPINFKTLISSIEQDPALNIALDSYIVKQAIHDLCELSRTCNYTGCISVNISPMSLEDPCFIEYVRNLLIFSEEFAPFQVDASRLILEITEREWSNLEMLLSAVAELTVLGVRIAVNGFMTGYAKFAVLLNENIDIVKVERCVSERLLQHENARIFAKKFRELTDHLNKTVIVEGVEDREQATWLHDHGYKLFQGCFFAVPTDLAGITRYLKTQSIYGH